MRPSWAIDVGGPRGSLAPLDVSVGEVQVQPPPVATSVPLFGFEASEGWGGGTVETGIVFEGARSRRLAASPANQISTFKAYPISPPVDLSAHHHFTIQTRLENGSPGFWQANLNLLMREGVTFNTKTISFPLAFDYQTNQGVWVQRSADVDWFGFDPTNIVEVVWSLSVISFAGGLAYLDDWQGQP